jgi:hypothetical protein
MANNTHRISRQVLELNLGRTEQFSELQQIATQVLKNQGMTVLEKAFNQKVSAHQLVRLERLDIDLGVLQGPDWPEQFSHRLAEQLEQSLDRVLQNQAETASTPSSPATSEESLFEQFLFFCQHGRLPWWGGKPAANWLEILQRTITQGQWQNLLAQVRRDHTTFRRLLYTTHDSFLESLLQRFHHLPEAARVLQQLSLVDWPTPAQSLWQERFWQTVLNHVATVTAIAGPSMMAQLLAERQRVLAIYPTSRTTPEPWQQASGQTNSATDLPPLPSPWQTWLQGVTQYPDDKSQASTATESQSSTLSQPVTSADSQDSSSPTTFKQSDPSASRTTPEPWQQASGQTNSATDLPPLPSPWQTWLQGVTQYPDDESQASTPTESQSSTLSQPFTSADSQDSSSPTTFKQSDPSADRSDPLQRSPDSFQEFHDLQARNTEGQPTAEISDRSLEESDGSGELTDREIDPRDYPVDSSSTQLRSERQPGQPQSQPEQSPPNALGTPNRAGANPQQSTVPDIPSKVDEEVFIDAAGMVILHPFLQELFRSLDLLEERQFRDVQSQRRAVALLTYLAFGEIPVQEYELLLPKLLTTWPWAAPLPPYDLTVAEQQACDQLMQAVLRHWSTLRSSSPGWLRETFFWREGKLTPVDMGWRLTIEHRAQDILLNRLPWGIGVIRLPWMTDFLHVNWIS